jgi:Tfp pilus assembly protein PilN
MSGPVVSLDFVAPRVRLTVAGIILLLLGSTALTAATFEYHALSTQRAGLELRLAASLRQATPDPNAAAHNTRAIEEATGVAVELGAPWTALLADLELASRDSEGRIAVLAIEPDHDKHRVRISGESKNLSEALAYLSRLQTSGTLQFPMLDSHEVVADDKEHPVRFTLTADWRGSP